MTDRQATPAAGPHPGEPFRWLDLACCLGLTVAAAAIGAAGLAGSTNFYLSLSRPAWAPPAGWFGPVWWALHVLMAWSAGLVWRERRRAPARAACMLYGAQLAAHVLWTWMLFCWHLASWAYLAIVLLLFLVTATGVAFGGINRLAGWLLTPCWLWIAYMAGLNVNLWIGNTSLLR